MPKPVNEVVTEIATYTADLKQAHEDSKTGNYNSPKPFPAEGMRMLCSADQKKSANYVDRYVVEGADGTVTELKKFLGELTKAECFPDSGERRTQILFKQAAHYSLIDVSMKKEDGQPKTTAFIIDAANDTKMIQVMLALKDAKITATSLSNPPKGAENSTSVRLQCDQFSCPVFTHHHAQTLAAMPDLHATIAAQTKGAPPSFLGPSLTTSQLPLQISTLGQVPKEHFDRMLAQVSPDAQKADQPYLGGITPNEFKQALAFEQVLIPGKVGEQPRERVVNRAMAYEADKMTDALQTHIKATPTAKLADEIQPPTKPLTAAELQERQQNHKANNETPTAPAPTSSSENNKKYRVRFNEELNQYERSPRAFLEKNDEQKERFFQRFSDIISRTGNHDAPLQKLCDKQSPEDLQAFKEFASKRASTGRNFTDGIAKIDQIIEDAQPRMNLKN